MECRIISMILVTSLLGFIFVLLDIFTVLEHLSGVPEIRNSVYIKLRIAINAYFSKFIKLFLVLFIVFYKLILEYIFSVIIENQVYNALLMTSILILGFYSYIFIFDVRLEFMENLQEDKNE